MSDPRPAPVPPAPVPRAPLRAEDLLDAVPGQPLADQLEALERIADALGAELGKAR